MVLKENSRLIINLTKTQEHGKVKCDKYWPSEVGESFSFEENDHQIDIVLITSESLMQNLIRRKLKIFNKTLGKMIREIEQLNYLSWPDHGAPE
jgi:protein tyrosine phosphatase